MLVDALIGAPRGLPSGDIVQQRDGELVRMLGHRAEMFGYFAQQHCWNLRLAFSCWCTNAVHQLLCSSTYCPNLYPFVWSDSLLPIAELTNCHLAKYPTEKCRRFVASWIACPGKLQTMQCFFVSSCPFLRAFCLALRCMPAT